MSLQFLGVRPESKELDECNSARTGPAGEIQLKKQLELNTEALLAWIYSLWVNVAGIMHPLDENPAVNRELNQLPAFLFPSQIATLMLVETEDLMPLIALIRCSYGVAISYASPTSGSTCPHRIHFALCDVRRIPLGSYLSDSSKEFHITTTTYGIYDYQRKETSAMRSPDAYGVSPGRVVAYPPEPGDRRCRLFRRLERGSGPESPGDDNPEIGRQEARRSTHRVALSLRLRHLANVL